jgi:hypothetical protein
MSKRLLWVIVIGVMPGCATYQAENRVNEEMRQEPGVFSQEEIASRSHEIILNHPSLSNEQRKKMQELFADVYRKNIVLRSEIGKLKGVLFKTLFSRDRKESEMAVLKRRLLASNEKKMNLMLDALDETYKILGKDTDPRQFERLFHEIDRVYAHEQM